MNILFPCTGDTLIGIFMDKPYYLLIWYNKILLTLDHFTFQDVHIEAHIQKKSSTTENHPHPHPNPKTLCILYNKYYNLKVQKCGIPRYL